MGNYENLKQSITEVIRTNGNQEITGAVLQSTLLTIISTVGANATFAGIATPATNPGTPDGPVFYLASESGTYTNFNAIELQDGLSILMWNGSWSSQQIFGIDNVPTAGSNNLVKSGGVQEELALGAVYDISAKNPTGGSNNDGKWESLSALLSDANLNTLIPTAVRRGGMSIKFVQSSDNKYVQYRLMANEWSIDTNDWAIINEGVYTENPEFLYVKTDSDDKILYGIQKDGNFYFGAGCPQQVKDYVQHKIDVIIGVGDVTEKIDTINEMIAFFDTINNDTTLRQLLETSAGSIAIEKERAEAAEQYLDDVKANKEEGKSLINAEYAEGVHYIESPEFAEIKLDAEERILEATYKDGTKLFPAGLKVKGTAEYDGATVTTISNPEFVQVIVDAEGKITEATRKDGKKFFPGGIKGVASEESVEELSEKVEELNDVIENINPNQIISDLKSSSDLGNIDYQKPISDINHCIIYGQSLSTGQQSCPSISQENYRGNLMIGTSEWTYGVFWNPRDSLNLLYARPANAQGNNYVPPNKDDQTNGETANISFANSLKRLLDGYLIGLTDKKFMPSSCGTGGQSIEVLSKDCPNRSLFSQFTGSINVAKELVNALQDNKTLSCSSIIWMQGEWNSDRHENLGWFSGTRATDDKDSYKALLIGGTASLYPSASAEEPVDVQVNGLVTDMIGYIMEQYSQEFPPIFLMAQQAANCAFKFSNPIDQAFLEAHNEDKRVTLVTSSYRVTNRGTHIDSNGTRWMGELFAKVWYKRVILGQDWKPLQPNKIVKGEDYLLIYFDVPEPPLVFDTNQVRAVSNYGFEIHNDGTNVGISSIEIQNETSVLIKCSSNLNGIVEIAYASYGKQYGNLRDSDPWVSLGLYTDLDTLVPNKPEGVSYRPSFEPKDENGNVIYGKHYPCQNFCLKFYYKIERDIQILKIKTK